MQAIQYIKSSLKANPNLAINIPFDSLDKGTQLLLKKNKISVKTLIPFLFFNYRRLIVLDENNIITNANDLVNKDFPKFHQWIKNSIKIGVPAVNIKVQETKKDNLYKDSEESFNILKNNKTISFLEKNKQIRNTLSRKGINPRIDEFNSLTPNAQRLVKFINFNVNNGLLVNSIYLYKNFLKNVARVDSEIIESLKIKELNQGLVFKDFIEYIDKNNLSGSFVIYVKKKIEQAFTLKSNKYNNNNNNTSNKRHLDEKTEKELEY